MTLGWLRGDFSLSSSSISRRGVMSSKLPPRPHDRDGNDGGGGSHRCARPPTERLSFARRLVLGFFCVNGMEPIWTLPSRFGLGITLIYVDWLHYYVHCAHPTLRCARGCIDTGGCARPQAACQCLCALGFLNAHCAAPRLPRARIHAEAIEQTPFKFSSAPSTGVQIQKLDVMLVQKTSWEVEPTNLMQKGHGGC